MQRCHPVCPWPDCSLDEQGEEESQNPKSFFFSFGLFSTNFFFRVSLCARLPRRSHCLHTLQTTPTSPSTTALWSGPSRPSIMDILAGSGEFKIDAVMSSAALKKLCQELFKLPCAIIRHSGPADFLLRSHHSVTTRDSQSQPHLDIPEYAFNPHELHLHGHP